MKTVMVSSRSKTLQALFRQARRNGLILQSSTGERFMLTPVSSSEWVGFDVGTSSNFVEEVAMTANNKELAKFLASRNRKQRPGTGIPIDEVRRKLGLQKKAKARLKSKRE
jgi:hypothetical protein